MLKNVAKIYCTQLGFEPSPHNQTTNQPTNHTHRQQTTTNKQHPTTSQLESPSGIAIDKDGHLLVSDASDPLLCRTYIAGTTEQSLIDFATRIYTLWPTPAATPN